MDDAVSFPAAYGPVNGDFAAGWSLDYASSNPNFIVSLAEWWAKELSAYSTDRGKTWHAFPSYIPGAGTKFMGGSIAASTPTNILWAPANRNNPYYTLDGGKTWRPGFATGGFELERFRLGLFS